MPILARTYCAWSVHIALLGSYYHEPAPISPNYTFLPGPYRPGGASLTAHHRSFRACPHLDRPHRPMGQRIASGKACTGQASPVQFRTRHIALKGTLTCQVTSRLAVVVRYLSYHSALEGNMPCLVPSALSSPHRPGGQLTGSVHFPSLLVVPTPTISP